ncbi:hypothetical protein MACH26_10250 [Planctobacterium marinum]|uniref:SnoaL-like domain-containing protein n=2 Tax=Planctobacterium marinum TaxID=1631968 RepID=A0AA48HPB0_9ALTE|nr:hypothetical protein MACH26_10250 [Planctobacterium marinum]
MSTFFAIYDARENFEQLLSYYASDAVLIDVVYGHCAKGKQAIREFLRWGDPLLKLNEGNSLSIQKQLLNGDTGVTIGTFEPITYGGQSYSYWKFVIIQTFDENGLIQKQVDWINYLPREDFPGGADINLLDPFGEQQDCNMSSS